MKRYWLIVAAVLVSAVFLVTALDSLFAQGNNFTPATPFAGAPQNRTTKNGSVTITSGNTFQTVLAALTSSVVRQSLTIQNNNTNTDNCWVFVGGGTATAATSILLTPGGSYVRYWPFVPSDAIQATCASTSDTLYVDTQ